MAIAILLEDKIINNFKKIKNNQMKKQLTPKQQEVLQLLACGLTEKQVAKDIHCSSNTIKYHKRQIFERLKVCSTTEAIVKSIKLGIMQMEEIGI